MNNISHQRSVLIRKNILASFVFKGWSAGVQFLLVPLTILCLGNYVNGLWLTIASMLMWIDNLDIGLGNGLRNKLAESVAVGDTEKETQYVSTAFYTLAVVMLAVALLLAVGISFVDIDEFLNVDGSHVSGFSDILLMSFVITCVTFVFKLTGNVYLALQLPAVNNAIVALGQTLTLLSVVGMYFAESHSLAYMALAYTMAPLAVNVTAFTYTFGWRYRNLRPMVRHFRVNLVKSLMSLGVKFFVLQVAGIVLFMSSNIVISHLFSPESVTPYQVAYRLFSLVLVIFVLVITPFWSATTDAYKKGDFEWIKSSQRKLSLMICATFVTLALLVAFSGLIYDVWIGDAVMVSLSLSIVMAIYIFEIVLSQVYSFMLNGMGVLNLQLAMTVFAAVVFIPLADFCGDIMGINGICIALILANLPGMIANILQFNWIINRNDGQSHHEKE